MTKLYPRGYLVVRKGEVETVIVKDPVQEAAIILKHSEATGTMKQEKPDLGHLIIEDD